MDYGGGSVRVLILGDSGVGKTTIARLLTTAGPGSGTPAPTVGCTCGVVRHVYHDAEYFVELLDIGGASKYQAARSVFYHNKDGLLLVHDVTNRKSNANIRCWIEEAMGTSAYSLSPITGHGGGVMLDIVSQSKRVPAFVIGNKADLLMGGASLTSSGSQPSLSGVVVGPDSITMSAVNGTAALAPQAPGGAKLHAFFDLVIQRKLASDGGSYSTVSIDMSALLPSNTLASSPSLSSSSTSAFAVSPKLEPLAAASSAASLFSATTQLFGSRGRQHKQYAYSTRINDSVSCAI